MFGNYVFMSKTVFVHYQMVYPPTSLDLYVHNDIYSKGASTIGWSVVVNLQKQNKKITRTCNSLSVKNSIESSVLSCT